MFCVGDPYENRTRDAGVRGRSLNRLTNGPFFGAVVESKLTLKTTGRINSFEQIKTTHRVVEEFNKRLIIGTPWRARTVDTLIKSQVLYQLS